MVSPDDHHRHHLASRSCFNDGRLLARVASSSRFFHSHSCFEVKHRVETPLTTESWGDWKGGDGNPASGWKVCAAPEPRDLVWQNVKKPLGQTQLHHSLGLAVTIFCLLFWSVPVTIIQAWANVGTLSRWIPAVV